MSRGDVLRRCDSWCHWHGRAQKPLFWAPSGCDIVASLSRFALRRANQAKRLRLLQALSKLVTSTITPWRWRWLRLVMRLFGQAKQCPKPCSG